jgi:hypothetical protein
MSPLSLEETETHLNMVADDRGIWYVYTDDPVMIRKMESIGATFVKSSGPGKHYTLRSNQVSLGKGRAKQDLTEEEREVRRQRMAAVNAAKKAST